MTSPTARTLAALRRAGHFVQTVERFCHFSKRRIDLFGMIDVLAIGSCGILGVQATSGDNVSSRIAKINEEPRAVEWMKAGGRLEVHGWRKTGARGKRKTWACRIIRAELLPGGTQLLWSEP